MTLEVPLVGPAGEPVDLRRTVLSHGTASLPPASVDEDLGTMEVTLPLGGGRPRMVGIVPGGRGRARVEVAGPRPGARVADALDRAVRRLLNLEEDLSGFYGVAAEDPELSWVTTGAGRMVRSPTVFEDVVKTLCTTNCSWALTRRMTSALVEHLGEAAPVAPPGTWRGRTFPSPEAMAAMPERFYRDVVRAGYRAPRMVELSRAVASGSLDLEALLDPELSDEEVQVRLLALPGIGPYGAAHVALTLGRYSALILDSWTRPTYARIAGHRRTPKDSTIVRRFRRYGRFAGLAFWCYLTRDWVKEAPIRG